MADNILAEYRFLPWVRRGLAAQIQQPVMGAPLPARAKVSVGITVSNVNGSNGVDFSLYGPGDVLGIDQRLIVRVSPRHGITDCEPNYFAAIDFDPPDFPWMFTPARNTGGPDIEDRLLPWLVLVVLDLSKVKPPTVDKRFPLPVVNIPAEVAGTELPDLSESWAWAHTQILLGSGTEANLANELRDHPDHNISRLICPRHLKPNSHYVACLVPAFDAGVLRGLGGRPDPKAMLAPAWSANPGSVKLPVYYHWEFATGPLGDFESLARKLRPFASPESLGLISMYIGDGNPVILPLKPDIDPLPLDFDNAGKWVANTLMDGALRAPARNSGALKDIDQRIQQGLQTALNEPARQLENGGDHHIPILGPPVYGEWHVKQHVIDPVTNNPWLYELNLDPRTRVAAGLGAEVVRKYQEDFMQVAWEQVGDVIKANNQLNWGRLSLEIGRHLYARHFASLPADRLLSITSSVHSRTRFNDATVFVDIQGSSIPNAVSDSAFRRLLSPQQKIFKTAVRRMTLDQRLAANFTGRLMLVASFATVSMDIDPSNFVPDGILSSRTMLAVTPPAGASTVDFSSLGLNVKVSAELIRSHAEQSQALQGIDFRANPISQTPRADLQTVGLITRNHVANAAVLSLLPDATGQTVSVNTNATIGSLLQAARQNSTAVGVLVTVNATSPTVFNAINVNKNGQLFIQPTPNQIVNIGSVTPVILNSGVDTVKNVVTSLPPGTLSNVAVATQPSISLGATGAILVQNSLHARPLPSGGLFSPNSPHPVNLIPPGGLTPVSPVVNLPSPALPVNPPVFTNPSPVHPTLPPVDQLPIPIHPTPVTPAAPATPAPVPATNTLPMPLVNVEAAIRFQTVFSDLVASSGLDRPIPRSQVVTFDLTSFSSTMLKRVDPNTNVTRRMLDLVKVDGHSLQSIIDSRIRVTPTFDRIMAAPDLPAPMYTYLAGYDPERFVPGIGIIPPNSITLLETNPRFIEAFMVGLNYEMNRELLWRAYPTDQRGTPFRHFWGWLDHKPDIEPIHTWTPANLNPGGNMLGKHTRGVGDGGQIVLLVRGELVRRYPNMVLFATKSTPDGSKMIEVRTPEDLQKYHKDPVFHGKLDPDIIFAGFDLTDQMLDQDGGWYFVIQEQPTEPRFGFDQPTSSTPGLLASWADVNWGHLQVPGGGFIRLQNTPINGRMISGLKFGANSAHIASIALQDPMQVAVHGRYLAKLLE